MDFATTAAITAAIAALVMLATRNFGERTAGLLAGLPYTTVPALVWIGSERGAEVAAQVAIGSVAGCALAALFAAAYDQVARRFAPALTLPLSLLALVAGFGLMSLGKSSLFQACALAVTASAVALAVMRHPRAAQSAATASPASEARVARGRAVAITALSAGAIGGGVVALASNMSPELAGLFATIPIVGATTATAQHATRGSASVTRFLRGYVISGLAEVAFSAVFAVVVVSGGILNALLLALLLSALLCCVADRYLSRGETLNQCVASGGRMNNARRGTSHFSADVTQASTADFGSCPLAPYRGHAIAVMVARTRVVKCGFKRKISSSNEEIH